MQRIRSMTVQSFVIILLLAGMIVVSVAPASACSCMAITPAAEFAQAGAVFVGEVSAIEEDDTNQQHYVQFSVLHTWKGEADMVPAGGYDEITVTTPSSGSACGYEFALHERYLVYAHSQANDLTVSSCGNSAPLLDALSQFAIVGTEQAIDVVAQPNSPLAAPTSPLPTPSPTAKPSPTLTPKPKR